MKTIIITIAIDRGQKRVPENTGILTYSLVYFKCMLRFLPPNSHEFVN